MPANTPRTRSILKPIWFALSLSLGLAQTSQANLTAQERNFLENIAHVELQLDQSYRKMLDVSKAYKINIEGHENYRKIMSGSIVYKESSSLAVNGAYVGYFPSTAPEILLFQRQRDIARQDFLYKCEKLNHVIAVYEHAMKLESTLQDPKKQAELAESTHVLRTAMRANNPVRKQLNEMRQTAEQTISGMLTQLSQITTEADLAPALAEAVYVDIQSKIKRPGLNYIADIDEAAREVAKTCLGKFLTIIPREEVPQVQRDADSIIEGLVPAMAKIIVAQERVSVAIFLYRHVDQMCEYLAAVTRLQQRMMCELYQQAGIELFVEY